MARKASNPPSPGQTRLDLGLPLPEESSPARTPVDPDVLFARRKSPAVRPKKVPPMPVPSLPSPTQRAVDLLEDGEDYNGHPVWSVSQLTHYLQQVLEEDPIVGLPVVIRGEVSNVSRSPRGHVYFSIKDNQASLSATLWAGTANSLPFELKNGLEVYATGTLEIYAPRGTYALIVKSMEPVGIGALQLAFQQLKAKLEGEGLFLTERKRALPDFPRRIGIITSRAGAVIHDMLRVLRRKNPLVHVLIHPVSVQGEGAAASIAAGIQALNHPDHQLDLLIVARGGGSFEDLFCFSEESVIRAIVDSILPVLTGIGHEPDYSLADAAADLSASTPTAAAERAVPDIDQLLAWTDACYQRLLEKMTQQLMQREQWLDQSATGLVEYHYRQIEQASQNLDFAKERLVSGMETQLQHQQQALNGRASELEALSPLATMRRGYCVALDNQGKVLSSIEGVQPGASFFLRLRDGQLKGQVLSLSSST